jgi:prolyl 4-hydroxylase
MMISCWKLTVFFSCSCWVLTIVTGFTPLGSSSTTSNQVKVNAAPHSHDFWKKERSPEEVKSHVTACLADAADRQLRASPETTTTTTTTTEPTTERVEVLSAEPPLVLIHNFLPEHMCNDIVQTAVDTDNWKESTVGSTQKKKETRTSSTVWLRDPECQHPLRLIAEKVSRIAGLPPTCQENLQVVKYQTGQEFNLHTDHDEAFNDLDCRGRLATCLVYLAAPDSGGETWFPGVQEGDENENLTETDITIEPMRGSAIFFFNTVEKPGSTEYSPDMFLHADERLRHAGLPVGDGEKWICNKWVHPIDFGAGVRGLAPVMQV